MNRREILTSAGAIAAGAAVSKTLLADPHDHSQHTDASHAFGDVILATSNCIRTAESCVAHCMRQFAAGNKHMAECNKRVHDMLAVCNAMLKLASYNSALAKGIAKACVKACEDCAKACKPHAKHHKECRACMRACIICAKACKKAFGV